MELWWLLATLTYSLSGLSTCGTILLRPRPRATAVLVGFAATPLATSRYEAGPTYLAILSLSSLALCVGSFLNMRVASAAAAAPRRGACLFIYLIIDFEA